MSTLTIWIILLACTPPNRIEGQVAPVTSAGLQSTAPATMNSDAAAIQAMKNVMAQSGGQSAWENVRSTEETFSVTRAGNTSSRVHVLLNDWSSDMTRYRNAVHGQPSAPIDHNGSETFVAQLGAAQYVVQEFDQARSLVGHLPAAAAEVMLRRNEYVLKISTSRPCDSGSICVDAFRRRALFLPRIPEQQWTIAVSTGLPVSIRLALPVVGSAPSNQWEEIRYLGYAAEGGLIIPVTTERIMPNGWKDAWTFVSLRSNCGFDTAKFDKEVTQ
jgi:hypothetical protein